MVGTEEAFPQSPENPFNCSAAGHYTMAETIILDSDMLSEDAVCTVVEDAPDLELVPSLEILQLQTLDSLENAIQAVDEFEECTASNFIVIEKQKHFGNEAFMPTSKVTVHWEGPVINSVCLNEYSGVPFVIVGRNVLGCHLGKDRALAQKKRYAESTIQKEITDNTFVKRRKSFQQTKKKDCPAKIYLYHILKFPDFQIKKKTEWQMRMAARKLKSALEKNIALTHSYMILFPELSHHQNHPVDGEVAHKKQKVDQRVSEKIRELFKSGVRKKGDIKTLVDHYVRHDLFMGQDLPIDSRRFFPSVKEITKITRQCITERRICIMDQSTGLQPSLSCEENSF